MSELSRIKDPALNLQLLAAEAGLQSVKQMSELSGFDRQTLNLWHRQARFKSCDKSAKRLQVILAGSAAVKE